MKENQYPEFRLDSFKLLTFLFSYRKLFIITGITAAIVSAIISLTLKPMYQSNVTMFPSSGITAGTPGLFSDKTNIVGFGDEEATEKVLQILLSDRISEFIAEKYRLIEHYEIDPESRYVKTQLESKMRKYISYRKTMYLSVQITVLDSDPVIAAAIANDISMMVDTIFNGMIHEVGRKYVEVIEKEYKRQEKLVLALEDSLYSSSLWKEAGRGYNPTALRSMGSLLTGPGSSPFTPAYLRLSSSHESALEDLGKIRQRLTEATMSASGELPYTMIINSAKVAERKAFPNRSAIVIISTLSALLLLLGVMIVLDGIKLSPRK